MYFHSVSIGVHCDGVLVGKINMLAFFYFVIVLCCVSIISKSVLYNEEEGSKKADMCF